MGLLDDLDDLCSIIAELVAADTDALAEGPLNETAALLLFDAAAALDPTVAAAPPGAFTAVPAPGAPMFARDLLMSLRLLRGALAAQHGGATADQSLPSDPC